jgi:hypothetical protein
VEQDVSPYRFKLAAIFMFEHRHQPLLPWRACLGRLAFSTALGSAFVLVSLAVGMIGYHELEGMNWVTAFVNAAMILSSMGPMTPVHTDAGKWFAGTYALYCGLALIFIVGIIFAPIVHRFLHHFHIKTEDE